MISDLEKKAVLTDWEHLHSIPETAWNEKKTAGYLAVELEKCGCSVTSGIAGTGVLGVIRSTRPGPSVALCADTDALPCGNGAAHLCAHDANCAMVLEAARIIARKGLESGTLSIVFQPAEEVFGGAREMVRHGILDGVDTLVGVHLMPADQAGLGQAVSSVHHSASCVLDVDITGESAHGSSPHLGCNAADAAAMAIAAANAVHVDPCTPHSIKATQIHVDAGAANIIPDKGRVTFDLRAMDNETMAELLEKTKKAVGLAIPATGCRCTFSLRTDCPSGKFDQQTVDILSASILKILGKDALLPPARIGAGDDFNVYAREKPELKTAYLGLGADLTPGLHNPGMTFDKRVLENGVAILTDFVSRLCN